MPAPKRSPQRPRVNMLYADIWVVGARAHRTARTVASPVLVGWSARARARKTLLQVLHARFTLIVHELDLSHELTSARARARTHVRVKFAFERACVCVRGSAPVRRSTLFLIHSRTQTDDAIR